MVLRGRGSDSHLRPASVEVSGQEESSPDYDFAHEAHPDALESEFQVDPQVPAGRQSEAVARAVVMNRVQRVSPTPRMTMERAKNTWTVPQMNGRCLLEMDRVVADEPGERGAEGHEGHAHQLMMTTPMIVHAAMAFRAIRGLPARGMTGEGARRGAHRESRQEAERLPLHVMMCAPTSPPRRRPGCRRRPACRSRR